MQLSRQDSYTLRCALSKRDLPEGVKPSPFVQLVLAGLDVKNNPDHWNILQNIVSRDDDVLRQVMAEDPMGPPPIPGGPSITAASAPELPKSAQLSAKTLEASQGVGCWLDEGMKWLTARSPMTPRLFLESGLLWAAGLAIARRAVLRLDFDDIYPHLYCLWIAPTTYYRKSTGLKAITHLVREVMPHMLLASQNTPELLIYKLAGEKPTNYEKLIPYQRKLEELGARFAGQRGIITDEATKLFLTKKYLDGLAEILMELYDAPAILERELRGEGKLIVNEPALSLLGATTPARLARNLTDNEWEDGLLARFLLLTPTEEQVKRRATTAQSLANFDPPRDLKLRLRKIYSAFPEPPELNRLYASSEPARLKTVSASMSSEALDMFNAYADAMHEMTAPSFGLDERLRGNYGRFAVQSAKIALILSIMDWSDAGGKGVPQITGPHWARAQSIVEQHRASVHRLIVSLHISQDVKNEERVIDFIRRNMDMPPSAREILRGTGIRTRKDLDTAIASLLEGYVIEEAERKTGGRPAKVYRLTPDYQG